MVTVDEGKFKKVIDNLTQLTQSGQVDWIELNPTTYVWSSDDDSGKVVLQRTAKLTRSVVAGRLTMKNVVSYMLQVFDEQGLAQLVVNSVSSENIGQLLAGLYDLLSSKKVEKGVDFLNSLIKQKMK